MSVTIDDELVEDLKGALSVRGGYVDFYTLKDALSAALTEPRVLRMAESALTAIADDSGQPCDCDIAAETCRTEADRLEKEQSRG